MSLPAPHHPISPHLHDHGYTLFLQLVGHTPRSRLVAAWLQLVTCCSSCINIDATAPSRSPEDRDRRSSRNRLRSRLAARRARSVFLHSIQLDFQTLSGKSTYMYRKGVSSHRIMSAVKSPTGGLCQKPELHSDDKIHYNELSTTLPYTIQLS
jgi:hypothetical protein